MHHESKNKIRKELDAQYLLDNKKSGKEAKDNNTTKIKKISLIDQGAEDIWIIYIYLKINI